MRLANLLDEALVTHNLKATTKHEAIEELLALVQKKYPDNNYKAILKSILDREEVENTSYGRGIAFPHARTDAVTEMYIA
ncbi:MAG: PTS sugar transporter subunit IIA, partial [candidate division Zixibacteria bacterium]|nr:PTS sugar transporter subunit IIA [candidate division Zixibacteria bacterium]